MSSALPASIGRYRVLEKLGEGGMGVVYSAHDDRLDRRIAVKVIRTPRADDVRDRFWREARAAASVSHPNICSVFEVGEDGSGGLFIAMELLEGESLAERLYRGPIAAVDAMRIFQEVLAALDALHDKQLVHRDLKPTNVFLSRHGVKLLDFGLVRNTARGPVDESGLTQTGVVVGTPRYMAPEQVQGRELDQRSDLFSAGLLLYEMLSGRPAFPGESMVQVLHAVVYETPPPIDPSLMPRGLSELLARSLAKRPDDRFASAAEMSVSLRRVIEERAVGEAPTPRPEASAYTPTITRLAVLPFRMLRPDPEIDFLAFSIPDAVSSGLAGLNALTVRPSATVAAFSSESPDISRIGREADVDVVLVGTLLRAGTTVRVTTQLVQAPSGTLIASHTSQAPLGDLFQLQDELTHRIVDALSLPLTSRERNLVSRDVPADPSAYETFLRANKMMNDPGNWPGALTLYREVVEKDQAYAPGWAGLGRAARVMAKYGDSDQSTLLRTAESAFRRALELNPDLSVAHHLNAYLDVELGRARFAMVRLLDRARVRRNDTELYRGLVIACRYCGLLEASAAAHDQARRLDPSSRSSVGYTYYYMNDFERTLSSDDSPLFFTHVLARLMLGQLDEANVLAQNTVLNTSGEFLRLGSRGYMAAAHGNVSTFLEFEAYLQRSAFNDPEALLLAGVCAAKLGLGDVAIRNLGRAIKGGHTVPSYLRISPWLESMQGNPAFEALITDAAKVRAEARSHYLAAGGEQLLGVGTAGQP